jgi:regulator of protease activity HflC (stomatin/prohibitin superfamily)
MFMFDQILQPNCAVIPLLGFGAGDRIESILTATTVFLGMGSIVVVAAFAMGLHHAAAGQKALITRGGVCREVHGPGLFCTIPIVERVRLVETRPFTVGILVEHAVFQDNVPVQVEGILSFRDIDDYDERLLSDSHRDRVVAGIEATLRSIINRMTVDEFLANRGGIARIVAAKLDEQLGEAGFMARGIRIEVIAPARVAEESPVT